MSSDNATALWVDGADALASVVQAGGSLLSGMVPYLLVGLAIMTFSGMHKSVVAPRYRNPRPRGFWRYAKKPRTTLRDVQARLRKHGITVKRNQHGEYVVNFASAGERTAYYTDDLGDAWSTGVRMSQERRPNPPGVTWKYVGEVVGTIPGQPERTEYQRTGRHRGPYQHTWTQPTQMLALKDGSVLFKPLGRGKKWGRY